MRNLSRALALTTALVLATLALPASAETLRECFIRCSGTPLVTYTVLTTWGGCCSPNPDFPNNCPAGSEPIPISWNKMRCVS